MIKTGRFPPTHGHISNKLKKQKKMMKKDLWSIWKKYIMKSPRI
jgi:hypothetical protein